MRVFFETNVLISAYVARGICADLLRFVLTRHELATGEVNLVELGRVLREKFRATSDQIDRVEAELRAHHWVASAIAGHADLLVTGDQDLLAIAAEAPVRIVSPRGCWKLLRQEG